MYVSHYAVDLFVVSVLLDAGAGDKWSFVVNGAKYNRSEGLGIASLEWFKSGGLSSDPNQPHQCDYLGLKNVNIEKLNSALQVSSENPVIIALKKSWLAPKDAACCCSGLVVYVRHFLNTLGLLILGLETCWISFSSIKQLLLTKTG